MPRSPDPSIRADLLARTLEHFENAALSSLSFRSLARALGVSTFSLVYHFGTRDQLLAEIVRGIAHRQKVAEEAVVAATGDRIDQHIAELRASFAWTLEPENRRLQRLEFEAAMIEALDPESHTATRTTFSYWMEKTEEELVRLGIAPEVAAIEARVLNNFFYGFQYDLVVNVDRDAVLLAFDTALPRYRAFLQRLVETSR